MFLTTIIGSILVAFGCALALWVLFNLFIELQPEASRTSPAPAIFFSAALIAVGVNRATGGKWRNWTLWSNRKTYVVAALCLTTLAAAFIYNVLLRLQYGLNNLKGYVNLIADVVFMLMCGRILKWLMEEWRSARVAPDDM